MSQIQQVSFDGPLGTLRGLLHCPDRTQPGPAIVMLHGFTGQHIEDGRLFTQAAKHLARAGFAVLRFDFFGSGDSDGEFDQFTVLTEVADAVAALDWITAVPSVDPERIGVVGLSMGGMVTALLAGQDQRVKAAVFWNAASLTNLLARITPHDESQGPFRVGPDFGPAFSKVDVKATLSRYQGPALIVRGTGDGIVGPDHAQLLQEALDQRGELHAIAGADHTFRRPEWQREAIDVTTQWLARQLKP